MDPGTPEIDLSGSQRNGVDSAAKAIPSLGHDHIRAGAARRIGRRQARYAGSNHDDAHAGEAIAGVDAPW